MPKGSRKAQKWEKIRAKKAKDKQQEDQQLIQRKVRVVREFEELKPRPSRHVMTRGMLQVKEIPSHSQTGTPIHIDKEVQNHDQEYLDREHLALLEKKRKATMVAPLSNKMGLVYIGDFPPEVITTLGRKV